MASKALREWHLSLPPQPVRMCASVPGSVVDVRAGDWTTALPLPSEMAGHPGLTVGRVQASQRVLCRM